jgi:hypothetical protein
VLAEGVKAGDEAGGLALGVGVAVEIAGTEVVVWLFGGQDVPPLEGLEVALVADCGPGDLDQDGLQVLVPGPSLPGVPLAGGLVVAGADPGPGRQVRCCRAPVPGD